MAAPAEEYTPTCIMVTGGAGFIASHVVHLLLAKYPSYRVVVLDCMDYCASMKNLEPLMDNPRFKFVKGNIKCADMVDYIITSEGVDTIMHFAAQTHVDLSFGNSTTFTDTNIVGTHTLLEVVRARRSQIRRFVHVSTDEVYGENASYHEEADRKDELVSALNPTNPYAASKAGAEMLVKSYGHSYGLPYVISRGNNVYGPRQFPEKLIPKMVMMLLAGQKLTVHGAGTSKRSYMHCDDVAAAFDTILHRGASQSTYNIGTSEEHTVLSVVQKIAAIVRPGVALEGLIQYVRDRPFNDSRYYLDTSALRGLGWEQRLAFDEGLERTVAWYLESARDFWPADVLATVLVPHPLPPGTASAGAAATSSTAKPTSEEERQASSSPDLRRTSTKGLEGSPVPATMAAAWSSGSREAAGPVAVQ